MSLAMRPNELNTEINRLQGAMPSSLFYIVETLDIDNSDAVIEAILNNFSAQ